MTAKTVKIPGPDHPITIQPAQSRVEVTLAGKVISYSRKALTLREAAYPEVHYIPLHDVDMAQLLRTDHASYCPLQGRRVVFQYPVRR